MDPLRRQAVSWLLVGSFLTGTAVGNLTLRPGGWVNGVDRLLFMCGMLLCGGLVLGRGCVLLREAKRCAPRVAWLAFLRRELVVAAVVASVMAFVAAMCYLLPASVRESIMERLHDFEMALHTLRAGHP
jgi:hypothetical protein